MRTLKPVALACALTLVLAACDGLLGATQAAATVNGDDIPASAVERRYDAFTETPGFDTRAQSAGGEEALAAQVKAEQLTELISAELLRQGVAQMGLEVTEQDVAEQRERVAQQYDEVGQDLDEVAQARALDEDDPHSLFRVLAYRDALGRELTAGQEHVTVTARHILVDDEERAEQVRRRLEAGEDFAELAQELSQDEQSAEQGGDLGELQRGDLAPALEEEVFAAEAGDLIGPVRSERGFHVVEIDEVRTEQVDELLQARQGLLHYEAVEQWLAEQLETADIDVADGYGEWDAQEQRVVPAEIPPQPQDEEAPEMDDAELDELEERMEELQEEQAP